MRVLFDTNIVLDVMLDRKPFSNIASQLFSKVESGEIKGFLSATTITTIYYITMKVVGSRRANLEIGKLFKLFEIAPINRNILENATRLNFSDFEDAVLHEAARHVDANAIVSRDIKGFKQATIQTYTPEELFNMLNTIKEVS